MSGFQQMQRGDSDAIDPAAEDAAATAPTVADRLAVMQVWGDEHKTLAWWLDEVRASAVTAGIEATDDEIRAEAQGRWVSFGDTRERFKRRRQLEAGKSASGSTTTAEVEKTEPADEELGERLADRAEVLAQSLGGPREYDVVDGEVRDWRRPDTTPDRGDVTEVHQVRDGDQRFSGAGAEDAQQQSMFLVPTDADFHGRAYRDAPELANLAEKLIGEHGFLGELVNCDVRWYWKRKTGVSKGRVKIGFMKRASDLLGHFSGADFIGWLSATTARDGKFTDTQVEAAVFHQLLHIGSDDNGNWIFAPHDFEGFAQEVRHYGTWTEDLKLGGTAFVAAHQMGLFDASDEDDDDEPYLEDQDYVPPVGELEDLPTDEQIDAARAGDPLADHDL